MTIRLSRLQVKVMVNGGEKGVLVRASVIEVMVGRKSRVRLC